MVPDEAALNNVTPLDEYGSLTCANYALKPDNNPSESQRETDQCVLLEANVEICSWKTNFEIPSRNLTEVTSWKATIPDAQFKCLTLIFEL